MAKPGQHILLERAEVAFLEGNFKVALHTYGLVLSEHSNIDEARIGVYLSELGYESQDEAQALFDYYHMIKESKKNAVDIIEGLIESLDSTKLELKKLLIDPVEKQIEYGDGIRYSDFLSLVQSRGNFKQAFEDIMFSTKVVITDKDEFIDFVTRLSNEGFDEMVLGYLDAASHLFGNDQDVLALYHTVRRNN